MEKMEWISVEDGKEMPDAFSYTGIRHNQFPRLVVAIDENSHVTHWMMLEPPKPKAQKFRKKPVVVEAYKTEKEIVIHTLEGDMTASVGDFIITGVNGEQYPCKPDIFEKTYEPYFEEEGESDA